jgi:hypothetical protein
MRSAGVLAALAVAAFATPSPAALRTPDAVSPVDRVNTYIGTGGGGSDYGGTMPFVTTPFGTTNWTARVAASKFAEYPNYGLAAAGLIGCRAITPEPWRFATSVYANCRSDPPAPPA